MRHIRHNFGDIARRLERRLYDFSVPLRQFYIYLLGQTAKTFKALGGKGSGTFRGVRWPWFAPIRIRRAGGTQFIPAEGIPGTYLGRLRHSGRRVTSSSRLMQDSGILRQAALGKFRITPYMLEAETPVKYADFQQKLRPYAFVTDEDINKLNEFIGRYICKID